MQLPDHLDRQTALAVQHVRNPIARADHRIEVLAGEALLFHPEEDGLNRIRRVYGMMLRLVNVDQRRQHIETIAFGRAAFGVPKAPEFDQRGFVILLVSDWLQLAPMFHLRDVDPVVRFVVADPLDPDNAFLEVDRNDKAISVAFYVERDSLRVDDARRRIASLHIG